MRPGGWRQLLLALALALPGGLAQARTVAPGQLSGRLSGAPADQSLDSAQVELLGDARHVLLVDALGRFRGGALPPGEYQLVATLGELGAEQWVTVYAGCETHTRVRLAHAATVSLLSVLWVALVSLLTLICGASMWLYGRIQEAPPREPWGPRRRLARRERLERAQPVVTAIGLWVLAFLLFSLSGPDLQPFAAVAAETSSAVAACLLTASVFVVLVAARPSARVLGVLAVLGLGLELASRCVPGVDQVPDLSPPLAVACWLGTGLGLLLWTGASGCWLASRAKQPSYLLLTALVAALLDIHQTFFGHTGEVMAQRLVRHTAADLQLLPWPLVGGQRFAGVIGWGDLLFLALFLAAAQRFEFGLVRNFWAQAMALTVGFVVAVTLATALPDLVGLPALPFMTVFLVAANRGRFRLEPGERRRILGFMAVLIVVFGLSAARHLARRGDPAPPPAPAGQTAPARAGE